MDPTPRPTPAEESVEHIVRFFERLTPQSLDGLDRIYAPDARFKDPFNDVRGLAPIEAVYRHMFDSLHAPRFAVTNRIVQGRQCFLVWDFTFRLRTAGSRAASESVRGGSHLVLAADGRISLHRDYWDAAGELYEKLPVLGALMRWLRRRVNG